MKYIKFIMLIHIVQNINNCPCCPNDKGRPIVEDMIKYFGFQNNHILIKQPGHTSDDYKKNEKNRNKSIAEAKKKYEELKKTNPKLNFYVFVIFDCYYNGFILVALASETYNINTKKVIEYESNNADNDIKNKKNVMIYLDKNTNKYYKKK